MELADSEFRELPAYELPGYKLLGYKVVCDLVDKRLYIKSFDLLHVAYTDCFSKAFIFRTFEEARYAADIVNDFAFAREHYTYLIPCFLKSRDDDA